jgi:hypothetical protein
MAVGRPWWQTTKTVRAGFVLGGFWAILGLAGQSVALAARGQALMRVIAVIWLVLAVGYLASAAALARRERSGSGARTLGDGRADP